MYFIAGLSVLSGLGMSYVAIRMMTSQELTVWLANAWWNPRGKMFTKLLGLERNARFHRRIVSPMLLVVSVGLFAVTLNVAFGAGK